MSTVRAMAGQPGNGAVVLVVGSGVVVIGGAVVELFGADVVVVLVVLVEVVVLGSRRCPVLCSGAVVAGRGTVLGVADLADPQAAAMTATADEPTAIRMLRRSMDGDATERTVVEEVDRSLGEEVEHLRGDGVWLLKVEEMS